MESSITETLMMKPSFDRREDNIGLVDDDSMVSGGNKGSDQKASRVLENGVDDFGNCMHLNSEIADGKFRANQVESGAERNVCEVGKAREINLVVDLSQHCSTKGSEFVKKANDVKFTEKDIKLDGGDRFSSLDSFNPAKTVDFLQDLDKDPLGINRLDVSTIGGQLSEFNKWKGYHQLQVSQVLYDDKGKLKARGRPRMKVRCMSDLMLNGNGSVSDLECKPKKRGRKRKAIESNGTGEGSQSQSQSQTADEFLSQIYRAARNPTDGQHNLDSLVKFASDFKYYRLRKDENDKEIGLTANQPETIETDMSTVTKSESSPKPNKENSVTTLTFKFTNLDSVPSVRKLHEIFGRYGALLETETQVLKKKKCVRLVFERKCDAEAAFSSGGKFSIFGPALICYRLNFFPKLRKTDAYDKKEVKSAKKKLQF